MSRREACPNAASERTDDSNETTLDMDKDHERDVSDHADSIAETTSSDDTTEDTGRFEKISTAQEPSVLHQTQSALQRVTSIGTTGTNDPDHEVDWDDDKDPENPRNWPLLYRAISMTMLSFNTLTVWVPSGSPAHNSTSQTDRALLSRVLYSTSYTSGVSEIAADFGSSQTVITLGLTFYLVGLAIGSMFTAPLSEVYGRKPVSVACLLVFTLLVIPCALARSAEEIIVVRFIAACFGSVMISSAPGMVADLVTDENRALYLSIWSIGPANGPGKSQVPC